MSSLTITFTPSSTGISYRVKYKVVGAPTFTTLGTEPTTSPIVIAGLDGTLAYTGTIESDCGGGLYSTPVTFNAAAIICNVPTAVTATLS